MSSAKVNVLKRLPKKNERIIGTMLFLLYSFMEGTLLLIVLYEFGNSF